MPGEYIAPYPQEIVFPNMESGRADIFYSATENLLINIEEESNEINEKTLPKISKYAIFGEYMYSRR